MLRQKRAVCICSTASVNIFYYCRIFHRKPVVMSETDPLFSIRSPVTVGSGKCRSYLGLLYVDDDSMSLEDFDKIFTTFMAERHICASGEYYA